MRAPSVLSQLYGRGTRPNCAAATRLASLVYGFAEGLAHQDSGERGAGSGKL
jgi:hypothetical protein